MIIILSFLFLNPQLSSVLFKNKRKKLLNNFLSNTQEQSQFDAEAFWKFREDYSSGYFEYNQDLIKVYSVLQFDKDKKFGFKDEILKYQSPLIESKYFLVFANADSKYFFPPDDSTKKIIYQDDNSLIYYQDENTIKLFFLRNPEEMNIGLFDYIDSEEVLKDKLWLNETVIKI